MRRDLHNAAKHVSSCLQLAVLLEVSAPKPGNVNRTIDFQSTRYEHFLASAVAVEPSFSHAAQQGILVLEGKIEPNDIGLGETVKDAVMNINAWQHGSNTLLGTVLLLSPIAAAAGMTLVKRDKPVVSKLRRNIELIVESTTPEDAAAVYEAISLSKPSGLVDKAPKLDINDPKSIKTILTEGISLYDVFKISAPYDSISREWVENYQITFEIGIPYFAQQLEETGNLNTAIIHTFLKVLSTVPDTLIARKVGPERAIQVSARAEEILRLGGLTAPHGEVELAKFDRELRGSANQLNPGTTADIIAAVLSISILNGYRP